MFCFDHPPPCEKKAREGGEGRRKGGGGGGQLVHITGALSSGRGPGD